MSNIKCRECKWRMPSRQRGSFYLKQAVRCTVLLRLYWVVKALHFLARCTVHWSGTNRPLSDHNWYMRLQEAQEQHCVSFFPPEWNRGLIGFIWHPVLTQYVYAVDRVNLSAQQWSIFICWLAVFLPGKVMELHQDQIDGFMQISLNQMWCVSIWDY